MKLSKSNFIVKVFLLLAIVLIAKNAGIYAENSQSHSKGSPPNFVENELLVKFRPGISESKINEINSRNGTTIKPGKPVAGYKILKINVKGKSVRRLVTDYRKNKDVEFAEPNYIVHGTALPNDIEFSKLWGLNNSGQTGGLNDADIDATEAWNIRTDSTSIITAVIDSGIDYNHEDLSGNMWVNTNEIAGNGLDDDANGYIDDVYGWDFANNDNDPFDDNSHGTHAAGTIAAKGNNSLGVTGVVWSGKIMALKFLGASGSGSTSDAIKSIEYATMMGAKVMSNSWGGGGFSQALKDAIAEAASNGVLFIAASGNNGVNTDTTPHYPSNYNVANVISVAATDHNDNLAYFSNYGPLTVDLGAPGVSTYSTIPNNGYGYKSGTSMATPHVAGATALLMAEFPELTDIEIKNRLLNAVDQLSSLNGKVASGGRLNIYQAILGVEPPPPLNRSVIFSDDVENGTNGWVKSNTNALWHLSDNRYNSPSTSWYYGIEDAFNYDTGSNNSGDIISPPIDLTTVTNSLLKFSHYLDTEGLSGYDKAVVSISTDNGLTYNDIFTSLTTNELFVNESINIALFDGNIIKIKFSFDTVDNQFNNFEGWYVDDITVEAVTSQTQPIAKAGPDQIVTDIDDNGIENITLDGSGSSDPDGTLVFYEWKQGSNVLGTSEIINADFQLGSHTVTLSVTDDDGQTDTDDVLIIVNSNLPPIANAGPDQTVNDVDANGVESVILDGSASTDIDGKIVSYEWKEGSTILGASDIITSDFQVGEHNVVLTVIDDNGAVDSDTVLLTVNPNQPPTALAGDDKTVDDSDGNGSESVTLDGSGSFDPDGTIASYEWKIADIVLGTNAILTTDFNIGVHTVALTVTDNTGQTNTDTVLVTVNQKPASDPIIFVSSIDINVSKKGPKYGSKVKVAIIDEDGNKIDSASVNGRFDINGNILKQTSKNTNKKGVATFDSGNFKANPGDTVTFTVTSVTKTGFIYDSNSNIETSDSATTP